MSKLVPNGGGRMDPTEVALLSPRFRAIAVEIAALPLAERTPRFLRWVATQPDRDEIVLAIAATDPSGPPPVAPPGVN